MTVNQNQPHRPVPPVSDPNQNFRLSVRLKYVKLGYRYLLSNALYILLVPLFAAIVSYLSSFSFKDISILYNNLPLHSIPMITLSTALLFSLSTAYFITRPRRVFLLDFSCYKPDSSLMVTHEKFMEGSRRLGIFTEDNLAFQEKIIERSGLGQKTYVPEPLHRFPPNLSMEESRKESETVMFGAIDSLLEKTGVEPNDIGILVTNCSLFNPTPSLSAMIVNKYKLRVNILSYNLGGMGCSAGLIAVDLVKQLLQVGGRAVLDEIEKSLDLSEWQMEPSRMTLNRFGNTSSSSIWYVLAYIEAKGRIKKGDRTWQIGFGSGFKCNSAVWKALKTIDPIDEKMNNPWIDEIHEFPIMLHGVDNHLP